MKHIGAVELSAIITAIAGRIGTESAYLNRLDAALGDGDHGTNVSRAFAAAVEDIAALDEPSMSAIWLATAKALLNRMGGASGALFGIFFLRGVALLRDKDALGKAEMGALLQSGLEGVKARGKANIGDKTMVDALAPAVAAFLEAEDFGSAWSGAALAARQGAASTRDLVARQGRAKFLGERGIGRIDPGATTVALIFEAIDEWWGMNAK